MQARNFVTPCQRSLRTICVAMLLTSSICSSSLAQQDSVSTWDAASFRNWTFIPYWTSQSQLETFPADNMYDHVSDVLYFSGVRPTASGGLNYHPWAAQHLATLADHAANIGFRFHMSMFDTYDPNPNVSVDDVWNSIVSSPTNRANFVTNVTNLMQANGMTGFNLDWERPSTDTEWANYTQLAKDLRDAINPLGMEVSVDDYGYADSDWDDTAVFDAKIYDQLFIMGYHYSASSNNSFANGKLALDDQGPAKAFSDDQLVLGIGTWGKGPAGTKTLKSIVAADPNLPYDAGTWTDGVNTWTIESREQVREKVQLGLDRNMAGVMNWTLHYDSPTELGLHRVAHHYIAYQRDAPDLNLDGKIDSTDANTLADNMGSVPGWTGTNTAARFDKFYRQGNWQQGDHNGNGFVNQADADWLAARYGALGVNLPDRLAYTGTFEVLQDGLGLAGRWRVPLVGGVDLPETGNFAQQAAGALTFTGTGPGADKHSDTSVTIRNQNSAEAYNSLNTAPREMEVPLSTPIDLDQDEVTYFTMLVRENTGPLLSSQLASNQRNLSLQFLDTSGTNQFDFSLSGLSGDLGINSQSDTGGEDVSASFFSANATYQMVGKITGNGTGANTLQVSLFLSGANVFDFTDPIVPWMLTAESSSGFNPTITDLRLVSLFEANYTVSNIQIGSANLFFPLPGDFDGDRDVDGADFFMWQRGESPNPLSATDLSDWQANYGTTALLSATATAVPEPTTCVLLFAATFLTGLRSRHTAR